MRKIVRDLLKCDELSHVFLNILCVDDGKDINDYTDEELVEEAKYQLEVYYETGTTNNDMLIGEYTPEEQREAKREVQQIKRFLSKYA
jgi:hypothetical protein